jgi:tetratricopeptide (TPR) repeat protein
MAVLAVLAAGCGARRPLPELPAVELDGMQAGVRGVIEPALAAARAKPEDAAVVARLGMALHAHQQLAGAAKAYQRAAELDAANPDYSYYWGTVLAAEGRYGEAIAPLRASLARRPAAAVRLRLADSLYAAGQAGEARREYEALVAADGSMAAAYYGLGRCLEGAEAVAALERAVRLFPRYGAARFALAGVYRKLGQRERAEVALVDYERDKMAVPPLDDPAMAAVAAMDESASGLLRSSQLLERQGRLAESAALQERVLASDPKLTQGWVNLISLYARLGRAGDADAAYRRAVGLEPGNVEAHYNFGVFCAGAERFADARAAFQRAVDLDPGHAEALDGLGAVVELGGALEQAAGWYRRAVAAKPGLRLAHYHLGRSLVNQRRLGEAIRELEMAAVEPWDDQSGGYLYALAAARARAGEREKAVAGLERAREVAVRFGQDFLSSAIERDLAKLRR